MPLTPGASQLFWATSSWRRSLCTFWRPSAAPVSRHPNAIFMSTRWPFAAPVSTRSKALFMHLLAALSYSLHKLSKALFIQLYSGSQLLQVAGGRSRSLCSFSGGSHSAAPGHSQLLLAAGGRRRSLCNWSWTAASQPPTLDWLAVLQERANSD